MVGCSVREAVPSTFCFAKRWSQKAPTIQAESLTTQADTLAVRPPPRGSWTPTAHILPIRLDECVRYCAKSAFSLPRASILGHAGKRVLR